MQQANELYYSHAAVMRFRQLEQNVRTTQLDNMPFGSIGNAQGEAAFRSLSASNALVMSPLFGAWLDRIIQAAHTSSIDPQARERLIFHRLNFIGNYAVAAALAGGEETEVRLRSTNNRVMIPEYGQATLQGADTDIVVANVTDGGITLTPLSAGVSVDIPHDMRRVEGPHWQPLRRIVADGFEVTLNDLDPNRDIFRYPPASRLTEEQFNQWAATFKDAWHFLQHHDPHLAEIMQASLTTIVPAPTEPFTRGKSMAAGAAFGVIGLNENRDPIRLASHLAFGMRKHMIMALRNERPDMYHSEDDPTSIRAVYPPSREGYGVAPYLQDDSFLNVGLAHFFRNLIVNADPALRPYGELSFTRWYTEAQQNLAALHASGYVRDANREVVAALDEEMAVLTPLFEAMPEFAKQAVATNTHDRLLSWRLHTILPDARAVRYLCDVWRRGGTCPSIVVPGSLSKSIDAYTHLGQRNRYVLTETRFRDPALFRTVVSGQYDPNMFGALSAGDIAFARQEIRGARAHFREAIRLQPGSPEAWAGFALSFEHERSLAASVLTNQPEVVAAVYAAISDASVEPEVVAAWLAPCRMADVLPA